MAMLFHEPKAEILPPLARGESPLETGGRELEGGTIALHEATYS